MITYDATKMVLTQMGSAITLHFFIKYCGLVYVGETGRSLRSRMNGHRSAIKKGGQSLLHRHFHQPNHSVDDMRVQILEKIYHSSGSPSLSTPLRRER